MDWTDAQVHEHRQCGHYISDTPFKKKKKNKQQQKIIVQQLFFICFFNTQNFYIYKCTCPVYKTALENTWV